MLTSGLSRFTLPSKCAQLFWKLANTAPQGLKWGCSPSSLLPVMSLQGSQAGLSPHLSVFFCLLKQSHGILSICYLLGQSFQAGWKSLVLCLPCLSLLSLWYSVHDCLESRVKKRLRRGSRRLTNHPLLGLFSLYHVLSPLRELLDKLSV